MSTGRILSYAGSTPLKMVRSFEAGGNKRFVIRTLPVKRLSADDNTKLREMVREQKRAMWGGGGIVRLVLSPARHTVMHVCCYRLTADLQAQVLPARERRGGGERRGAGGAAGRGVRVLQRRRHHPQVMTMMMMVMSCRRAVTSGHCCWPCRPSYSCLLPCWPRLSRTPFNEKAVASHVRAMLAGLQAYHTNGVREGGREGARQGKVFITVWRMIATEAIWLAGWLAGADVRLPAHRQLPLPRLADVEGGWTHQDRRDRWAGGQEERGGGRAAAVQPTSVATAPMPPPSCLVIAAHDPLAGLVAPYLPTCLVVAGG